MARSLRFDGESDNAFRVRAERAGTMAKVLVEACLENNYMQEYIADPTLPYSAKSVRSCPTVRIEYEEAIAIGGIGETLRATRSKHWGDGPVVRPLEPEDFFYPERITYLYRANSRYNRRFEQRIRMKELLGRDYRKLVGEAKHWTKRIFLRELREDQAAKIERVFGVSPGEFWRAVKGHTYLRLPPRAHQLELDFGE